MVLYIRCIILISLLLVALPAVCAMQKEGGAPITSKTEAFVNSTNAAFKDTFPKIAVVQIEQVLGEFRGKLKDQFSKYLDKYYKEFSGHEEKLREEHRGLLEQQKGIKKEDKKAQEAWTEKMREFEARIIDIQKIGEEKRHRLEQQYNQIIEKIYHELRDILKDLAVEKGISLFIKDQHVLHWDPALDMTDIVYKRLKGRIAERDLKFKESGNGE